MTRTPLPSHLTGRTFLVREAAASDITAKRLRGRDLDRSVWGVRRPAETPAGLCERCRMLALRLPEQTVFSHVTAALLLGAPVPWRLEHSPVVDVMVPAPLRAPHAAGIRGHRRGAMAVTATHGVRHTDAAHTWRDLAAVLPLPDLVAVGDFLIHWRQPLTTHAELSALVARSAGLRGAKRMRVALSLLNDRAESGPESILRVMIEQSGLPRPTANPVITYWEGRAVARPDLAFLPWRTIIEYQGDYHRTEPGRWRADMTRRSRLEAEDWAVMEVNAEDLRNPDELLARIRTLLFSQGWRP